ncbi:patatin-like phospholipase family protein [Crocosphaera sp. XPORK-15E]|uniref:patatin-like phospholipase family protein n=1 Tax=Crocosphaera sp. XPORK-15E TaxID=3110247 RepID=UPI002B1FD272|nr:patatin-like phospholipase family protein [Crocosphaera sp. XPORK-15E]MEA5536169.1 patatin-like phospholipase family protein [Crocosphaera sp. XPORK-15E]
MATLSKSNVQCIQIEVQGFYSMIKILSIDGGGIRGILPAMLLAEIENRTNKKTVELFDLIAGTSTGGILALGLNKPDLTFKGKPKYSAQELVDLYEKEGTKIFRPDLLEGFWTDAGGTFHPKYPFEGLEQVLDTYFGDTRLSESLKDVLITSYDLERRRPQIFLSSQAKQKISEDFPMKLVGRATSAAPTYFEPLKLNKPNSSDYYALVDGGVYANNPAMYAYVEAKRVYKNVNDDFVFVSLGTGEISKRIPYENARTWGLANWAQPILDVVFDGVDDAVNYQLQQLIPYDKYYRVQPILINVDERMDNAKPDNVFSLKLLADNLIHTHSQTIDRLCKLLV